MATESPLPDDHELSSYGFLPSSSSSSNPLLPQSPTTLPRKKRRPSTSRSYTRWWRPILIISLPILLIVVYAVVHPHVPGLPALPRVILQTGSEPPQTVSTIYAEDSECTCGHTKEGERLCSLYHRQSLRATRLVQGTGARVRRTLLAAREGKALKVGILGGSGE